MKNIIIKLIRVYQRVVSPVLTQLFGKGCIFTPTCSEYTIQSLNKFGIIKGTGLSIRRIIKCRPGSQGGYDPIK